MQWYKSQKGNVRSGRVPDPDLGHELGFGPSTSATRGDPWVADVCCTGSLLLLLEPGRHDFLVRVHPFLGRGLGRHAALNVSGYGILVLVGPFEALGQLGSR